MPTYEYACRSCGEHLEIVQSFKDDPITECPACGGSLRKVFGSVGIVFKGSGFYKTDSRPSSKVGAGAPAGPASGSESKSPTPAAASSDSSSRTSSGESSSGAKPSSDTKSSSDSKPKSPAAASA
jgi:putative FmdB family regulatory protein